MIDIIEYFLFNDISKINDDIFDIKNKEKIDPKVKINFNKKKVIYQNNYKIVKEYFNEDINSLFFSFINYTGDDLNNELIGYKFCYEKDNKKDNIILIKSPFDYYPKFFFYNTHNKNIEEIVKKYIFEKIDYNKYSIGGSKIYIYFYLNILLINKEEQLKEKKIKIIIIDENIDSFIPNYIKDNEDDYLYIYLLLFKEHIGTLFFFNSKYFLFDSSLYFKSNFENIFKTLSQKVIILNKFSIQNLGTCTFHNIAFLENALYYILKDKKYFISNIDKLVNSIDFIFEYINKLNTVMGGEEEKIIFRTENEDSENYFLLNKDIYLSKKAFKINLINYKNLFDYLNINKNNNITNLIMEENSLYLTAMKIISFYQNLKDLLLSRINDLQERCKTIYYKKKLKLKNNNNYLERDTINRYYNFIDDHYFVDESLKKELKIKIREEIREKIIDINKVEINENNEITNKNDINDIIKSLEGQIILQYYMKYSEEFVYYYKMNIKVNEDYKEYIKLKTEILETIEKYNYSPKIKYIEISEYIKDKMAILNKEIEELDILINTFN